MKLQPLLKSLCFVLIVLVIGLMSLPQSGPAYAVDIAILKSAEIAPYTEAIAGFKASSPPHSRIREYALRGDVDRGRRLAEKIRASDAELVVAVGLKAALVAKLEILDIPVLYCMVLDPLTYGLSAPNMTGVLLEAPTERQFSTLRAILPAAKRVGVLYDPQKTPRHIKSLRHHAKRSGIALEARQIQSEKELPSALRALLRSVDALWLLPDSTVLNEDSLPFIMSAALESNVPVIGFSDALVRSGALFGMFVDYHDVGRQAAVVGKKILEDEVMLPSSPFPPAGVKMAVNLKIASFLGIQIPTRVLNVANELY